MNRTTAPKAGGSRRWLETAVYAGIGMVAAGMWAGSVPMVVWLPLTVGAGVIALLAVRLL